MLTIKEICDRTNINVNTFHAWRRANWRLLPDPIGVAKKTIYFDDSIIERIYFIKSQRLAGKSLPEIQAMLEQQKASALENSQASERKASRKLTDSRHELLEKWNYKDCKNEVCLALKLDPVISSYPTVFVGPQFVEWPFLVHISIISNNYVHFAELGVNEGEERAEVKKHEKMLVEHYGLFAGQIIQRYVEHNSFVPVDIAPYMLLSGYGDEYLSGEETVEFFKEAKKLTKVIRAGQEFIKHL